MNRWVLVGLGLGLATASWAQADYPAWFLHPPGPGWVEVFASSDHEAVDRAATVLAAYEQVRVVGDFQQFDDPLIDDRTWKNSDYTFEFDPSRRKALAGLLKVYDGRPIQLIQGENLYLVGPIRGDLGKTDSEGSDERPSWADLLGGSDPSRHDRYGVGRFSLQGNTADAWVKAEELAVLRLLEAYELHIAQWTSVSKKDNDGQLTRLQWIRLHYEVSALVVAQRWVDAEHNDALVLVTCPSDSVQTIP